MAVWAAPSVESNEVTLKGMRHVTVAVNYTSWHPQMLQPANAAIPTPQYIRHLNFQQRQLATAPA